MSTLSGSCMSIADERPGNTHTQTKYHNPRCTCVLRVKYSSEHAVHMVGPLTHVVAILEVVEVATKELLILVKPHVPQFVDTLALTLLQRYQLVNHSLHRDVMNKRFIIF